ncbi:NUDIX domain-containing protein [Roseomonas sp. CCTCC AB2023176]|uniref:NUDIX hydrolase n=1 Tax=Roseomonas sp. CCTCC AB2023176 TaxID=3342640 RepID=UPI0035E1BCAA
MGDDRPIRQTDFTADGEPRPETTARPRDAATIILWREGDRGIEVLMGVRSARHRFMPQRLVFPGGRVDPMDRRLPIASELEDGTRRALELRANPKLAQGLAVAAVRELHEETGLIMGRYEKGRLLPDLAPLRYLCRALTPPQSPVRFNARFLMAPARAAVGSLGGSGELEHLGWYPIGETPPHELALITARVLEEFRAVLAMPEAERERRPLVWFQGRDTRKLERTSPREA